MLHQIDSAGVYALKVLPWWIIRIEQSPQGFVAHIWKPESPRFQTVGLARGKARAYRQINPWLKVWSGYNKRRTMLANGYSCKSGELPRHRLADDQANLGS